VQWGDRDKSPHAYSLNTSHPGAAAYYASVTELYESWDLDFVKVCTCARA
jgi:hypothetical protein